MFCRWQGVAPGPNGAATTFAFINHNQPTAAAWITNENSQDANIAVIPLSDPIVITKLSVQVGTAPGGATGWTIRVRQNLADTAASVTISGAATSAVWTGAVSLNALDLICMAATNFNGTPAGAGHVYWQIEYTTAGNFYLLPAGNNAPFNSNSVNYQPPCGGNSITPTTVATDFENLCPTELTVTKIAATTNGAAPATNSDTFVVRKNNATDSTFSAVITGTGVKTIASAVGSLAFVAGDTIVVKVTPSASAPWARFCTCLTVVPAYSGEQVQMFGNLQASSTSAVNYETARGAGNNAWNATEANVAEHSSACTLKKLYVKLVTAPGGVTSRTFTIRSGNADSGVTTTITGAATTGNDTIHAATHPEGANIDIAATPTSTPAASAGVKLGYVQVIPQPRNVNVNQALQSNLR